MVRLFDANRPYSRSQCWLDCEIERCRQCVGICLKEQLDRSKIRSVLTSLYSVRTSLLLSHWRENGNQKSATRDWSRGSATVGGKSAPLSALAAQHACQPTETTAQIF